MKGGMALAALVAIQATASLAGPPPADVAQLYRMASAYEVTSGRRVCADASLAPRFDATRERLARARRAMADAYDPQSIENPPPPIVAAGNPCADSAAAANSIAHFEQAVAQLEAALPRIPRG